MDFLFAPLPETNFQMTDDQLVLWQRNAIFECECDNFINRRIEAGRGSCQRRHLPNLLRRPLIEPAIVESAIDMAIEQHGLHAVEANVSLAPVARRPRLFLPAVERDNSLDFYQEAIAAVIRERGLGLHRNP